MRVSMFLLLSLLVAFEGVPRTAGNSYFFKGDLGFVALTDSNDTFSGQSGFQAAAVDALKGFLAEGLGASGNDNIQVSDGNDDVVVDKRGNVHIRFHHYIDGLEVEGAALMMHIKRDGRVSSINGEYAPSASTDFTEAGTLECPDAINVALLQLGVESEATWSNCTMAAVNGRDGLFQKAYKAIIEYSIDREFHRAFVFASPTTGDLVALHPQLFGASMVTKDCQNTLYSCRVVSSSTRSQAVSDALKNSKATLDFYMEKFSRDSVDGKGATITLHVNYDDHVNNAYYGDMGVYYGSGDGSKYTYFSKGMDVTAHEITHGVTYYTSRLTYENDSGAMNEAMSDIFAATVERVKGGKGNKYVWLMGEDVTLSGLGVRNMANPAQFGHSDWYPTRYQGSGDYGGVHTNSGIMNLAFQLMVEGGTHPRGMSSTVVTPLSTDFDTSIVAAAGIFYKANTACLTPSSNFVSARECTVSLAGSYASQVAAAWDAVGVPSSSSTVTSDASVTKCLAKVKKSCKCGSGRACWRTVAINQCTGSGARSTQFLSAVKKSWIKFCSG